MTDTVIKGSGNSRSLKTVPNALTMYPTHEAMIAAMVDGTFPIDLGPLNDAGVQTRGMDLNKANLLKDTTAALYGLGDNASPDEVLAVIAPRLSEIDGKAKCVSGYYTGTGTENQYINCGFPLKAVLVVKDGKEEFYTNDGRIACYYGGLSVYGRSIPAASYGSKWCNVLVISGTGFYVYYESYRVSESSYLNGYDVQTNGQNQVYHYVALG